MKDGRSREDLIREIKSMMHDMGCDELLSFEKMLAIMNDLHTCPKCKIKMEGFEETYVCQECGLTIEIPTSVYQDVWDRVNNNVK